MEKNDSHSLAVGYIAWIFGFMGAHRFYFGRPVTGTIWFFTLGLFFVGWIIDFFLIPSMEQEADNTYIMGETDYSVAWLLLFFTGIFGIHRMYMGKWLSGIIYLFTLGLFGLGILYDLWTLNRQVHEQNSQQRAWAT
ncbi:TM2 domain-containing membrane protein YozV [Alteromonadaceae bacterium Bs31]|nr:TM2 domain-containing membrane protein YozV [Alteromonadaceae bacterium Bs31]